MRVKVKREEYMKAALSQQILPTEYITLEAEPIEEFYGKSILEDSDFIALQRAENERLNEKVRDSLRKKEPKECEHRITERFFTDKEEVVHCLSCEAVLKDSKPKRINDYNSNVEYKGHMLNHEFDNIYAILEGMRK